MMHIIERSDARDYNSPMFKEGCPGSIEIRSPKPEEIRCQQCGEKIEIWSDEPDTACKKCGHLNARPIGTSCVEWCAFAKECVGAEKLEKLLKASKG
jgi:hypothetical protein